ncbi:MAG: eukaryotic-like serine/threonine-protein kinase [Solirubrobacteraceae bacterium]|jgi:serine/threonine-protein kinase|nr:eukaryotic-like serine/threonine-protein kinase [Solirubrobacteraceae bacterium]
MQRRRRRVSRWLPILVWAGIMAGVAALVVIYTRPDATAVTRAATPGAGGPVVPAVAGRRVPDAWAALERAGYWVTVDYEPSRRVRVNRATGTTPAAGMALGVGGRITLLVSSGRPRVRVPSLSGLSRSAAEERLGRLGLRPVIVARESLESPGAVVGQSPDPGRRVTARSAVRVAVAAPPPPVEVPGVTGLGFEEAVSAASGAGLTVEFAHRRATRPADVGRVLGQSLGAGQGAPRGARIVLTVGVRR